MHRSCKGSSPPTSTVGSCFRRTKVVFRGKLDRPGAVSSRCFLALLTRGLLQDATLPGFPASPSWRTFHRSGAPCRCDPSSACSQAVGQPSIWWHRRARACGARHPDRRIQRRRLGCRRISHVGILSRPPDSQRKSRPAGTFHDTGGGTGPASQPLRQRHPDMHPGAGQVLTLHRANQSQPQAKDAKWFSG